MNQLASVNMCPRDLTLSLSCCTCTPTVGFELRYQTRPKSCKRLRRIDTLGKRLAERFQIPAASHTGVAADRDTEGQTGSLIIEGSSRSLSSPGTSAILRRAHAPSAWREGDLWADIVCVHAVPRAAPCVLRVCGCV